MTLNEKVFQEEHILYVVDVKYLSRLPAGFFLRGQETDCCMSSLAFFGSFWDFFFFGLLFDGGAAQKQVTLTVLFLIEWNVPLKTSICH